MQLKKYFINKKFHKLLIEKEANRVVSTDKIKTVGIISSDEITNWMDLQTLVENELQFKNTKIYSFRSFSKKNPKSYKHFSEKDFSWKGEIKDPNFKVFVDQPFDLLIGYFNKNNLYLEHAVLQSAAKFKVGFSKVNQALFDMEISTNPQKADEFLIELKKYLHILKKL